LNYWQTLISDQDAIFDQDMRLLTPVKIDGCTNNPEREPATSAVLPPTESPATQCDQTQSPLNFSGKRELCRRWAETFGTTAQRIFKLGIQRLLASGKKPTNGGLSRKIEAKISTKRTGWLTKQESNREMPV